MSFFHQGNVELLILLSYIGKADQRFTIVQHITLHSLFRRKALLSDTVGFISDLPIQVSFLLLHLKLGDPYFQTFFLGEHILKH